MFTGLVEELGVVEQVVRRGSRISDASVHLVVKAPRVTEDVKIGDSIAVNGCCLTVVKRNRSLLGFDAGSETLSRTNLGRLDEGSPVNLERSLKVGDRLGGHLVTGHIDAVGTMLKRRDEGDWAHFVVRIPTPLSKHLASKGSIAVDGVSLTLVNVESDRFSVALIPHTLEQTTLGMLEIGDAVNIETDVLAKYVERQLATRKAGESLLPSFAE